MYTISCFIYSLYLALHYFIWLDCLLSTHVMLYDAISSYLILESHISYHGIVLSTMQLYITIQYKYMYTQTHIENKYTALHMYGICICFHCDACLDLACFSHLRQLNFGGWAIILAVTILILAVLAVTLAVGG